jgi:hypothetical protein
MVDMVDINVDANNIVEYMENNNIKTKNFYNIVVIDSILVLCCLFSLGCLVILYKFRRSLDSNVFLDRILWWKK